MARFAANLSMMFTEAEFPARFERAAKAGFKAVEFLFPYDYSPGEAAGWLRENGLAAALFNMSPGARRNSMPGWKPRFDTPRRPEFPICMRWRA